MQINYLSLCIFTDDISYLDVENLSNEEKQRLHARLQIKSKKITNAYAILVDKTRASLEKQNISAAELLALIKQSYQGELVGSISDGKMEVRELFDYLKNYWSFFDYELLKLFINRHCQELIPSFEQYISEFKAYCQHRLHEVPSDCFNSGKKEGKVLVIICDKIFSKSKMTDVKEMESELEDLLGIYLHLFQIEEGSIKLMFSSLFDISQLNGQKMETLCQMGVIRMCIGDTECYNKFLDVIPTKIDHVNEGQQALK